MRNVLTVGSLFSGIGGFDLGFERAGMRTVWFCEQDEFCQRVLAKHWPGVPVHSDVRALVADTDSGGRTQPQPRQEAHRNGNADALLPREHDGTGELVPVPVPYVDILCGGFPCQDISVAGRGEGIDGARSGLWGEYARLIRDLRPRYVVVENVAALLARGMERVLGDLAACGYDAEWDCIPASAVGAPHRRDRVWLVAYAHRGELREQSGRSGGTGGSGAALARFDGAAQPVACPNSFGGHGRHDERPGERPAGASGAQPRGVGDPDRMAGSTSGSCEGRPGEVDQPGEVERTLRPSGASWEQWLAEPDVGRVANGIPQRVDRLRALGNSLVPQIAEWIGERIVVYEEGRLADAT